MDKFYKDSIYLLNNGMFLCVTTIICVYLGKKTDDYFHTNIFVLIFGILGVAFSIYYYLYKLPLKREQESKAEEEKEMEKEKEKKDE